MNPFTALNLPADPHLSDEDVRAAWRTLAAAAHPDRADGGDPAAYAAGQQAYAQLRTAWGRSEALADLAVIPHVPAAPARDPAGWLALLAFAAVLPARVRKGRPRRIAARAVIAAAAAYTAVALVPGTPSAPAAAAGCALWWLAASRADLAPPPGR